MNNSLIVLFIIGACMLVFSTIYLYSDFKKARREKDLKSFFFFEFINVLLTTFLENPFTGMFFFLIGLVLVIFSSLAMLNVF